MKLIHVILFIAAKHVSGQINLGTLNLNKNPQGDLEFGLGQSANIFGFGGDREIAFTAGPGKFDTQLGGGALVGGERLGLDSGVGVRENQGLNLGSMLKFGNQPPNPNDPAGQLNSFINNVGYFFQRFMPPPGTQPGLGRPPPPSSLTPPPEFRSGINSGEFIDPEQPSLIPDTETRPERPHITTEGRRRDRPPVPDGFASIDESVDETSDTLPSNDKNTNDDETRLADLQ